MPARAASYLDPILALHNIESRQKESALGWGRVALGAALLLISMLLIEYSPLGVGMVFQFSYAAIQLLGLTILLPMLVHWAARAIRPAMDWLGGSEGALAVDAMIQSPRRSAATVGALMVGLMFVYSTAAYIQSYKHMIGRWTNAMLNADLFVSTSTLLRSTSYHFSEDLGNRIAALPEVKRIENIRFTIVPYRGDTAALSGSDLFSFLDALLRGGSWRQQEDSKRAAAARQRCAGFKEFRRAVGKQSGRLGAPRHADRLARFAHSWNGRGLPLG